MDKSKAAFRSYAITNEPELSDLEVPESIKEAQEEAEQITAEYASLKNHPGWKRIKSDFDKTIASYRSGRSVAAAISKGKSNEQIGDLVRTSNAIADELERIVLNVETASEIVEKKDGRKRRV